MNFGSTNGLNSQGQKIQMIKESVEKEINQPRETQMSLTQVFTKFKPINKTKISTAKKNKKNLLKNNSPRG